MDPIITINERGIIESFNPAAERLFGYPVDEVVGKSVGMLMPSTDPHEHDRYVERYLATGCKKIIGIGREVVGLKKDGTTFPMDLAVSEVRLGDRRIFTGVLRDITKRKEVESKLARQSAALARSNIELEQFAYVASHDLQEPLRTIGSFAQLLARRYQGRLDSTADEFIAFIVDGATRMQAMINDLLAYSRVGRGSLVLRSNDFEVILEHAIANLRQAIDESGAVVTHDPLPSLWADDSQIDRLFQNLIGNAIKYRGTAAPRIHVSAERQNGDWIFAVRDNGIGFDPKHAERIFVAFQRLHTRDTYPGTGIGLAICKKIVERRGGRIWAESEPGRGSRFCFAIPAGSDGES